MYKYIFLVTFFLLSAGLSNSYGTLSIALLRVSSDGKCPADSMETAPIFSDEFNAPKLDTEKWQVSCGLKNGVGINSDPVTRDGYLQLNDCTILTRQFKMKTGIIEFKARTEKKAAIQLLLVGKENTKTLYSSGYPGAEHTIAVNDIAKLNIAKPIEPGKDYIYKVSVTAQGIIFERFDSSGQKEAEIQFLDIAGLEESSLGLKSETAPFDNGSVYFDWIKAKILPAP